MEPSWHQNGVKNRCQLRKAFFHETHSRCSGGSFCRIKRVEVGSKHGPKIDQKMGSTRKGILASIFISITAHLGAILALSGHIWGHLGAILAPCSLSLGQFWPHLGSSWVYMGPSWLTLAPSWRHLGPSWPHLGPSWLHLGAFLVHLARFWHHLSLILARLSLILGASSLQIPWQNRLQGIPPASSFT